MTLGRTRRSAGGHRTPSSAVVDRPLRCLEPFGVEALDGIGRRGNQCVWIVVRIEVREQVVGEGPRVTATGSAHADAESEEVGRPEVLSDRAKSVVPGEPAAEPCL